MPNALLSLLQCVSDQLLELLIIIIIIIIIKFFFPDQTFKIHLSE